MIILTKLLARIKELNVWCQNLMSREDYTCYKETFLVNFIVPIDHKITCCKEEELYVLNGINTVNI